MDEKIFSGISSNTMFQYEGTGCKCVKDTINVALGEAPTVTLKAFPDPGIKLLFSYAPKVGLNITGIAGGVHEENILGKLLSLPKDDVDACKQFIEKYGFFFPLPKDEYTAIKGEDLLAITNRIKATVRLYNRINKKDYQGILIHLVYLLFTPETKVVISGTEFSTCLHKFSSLLQSYNLFPDLSTEPEVFARGTYSVEDSFIGQKNPVAIDFYNSVRSGTCNSILGGRDPWFKRITAMYVGCRDVDEETRNLIDFFFHFQTEVSAIKEVHYGSFVPYTKFDETALNDAYKNALIKLARIVVAEEINHNIRGIHPRYEGGKLTATWQVDTLLEALYFSIFYMRSGEMYKECENPNCKRDKFFLVEATRTNKRYCCEQCRNAASAKRHRNIKKSGSTV